MMKRLATLLLQLRFKKEDGTLPPPPEHQVGMKELHRAHRALRIPALLHQPMMVSVPPLLERKLANQLSQKIRAFLMPIILPSRQRRSWKVSG
jgi:hypothetical protein